MSLPVFSLILLCISMRVRMPKPSALSALVARSMAWSTVADISRLKLMAVMLLSGLSGNADFSLLKDGYNTFIEIFLQAIQFDDVWRGAQPGKLAFRQLSCSGNTAFQQLFLIDLALN